MIDSTSTCPDCGTPLPSESSHSLCPACLMRQALASRTLADAGDKTPQLPPPSPEEIADHFPGYEVLECLGRGGMGAVYKARQKSLNRLVAIKILAPERIGEGRFAQRFGIEAELLAKLGHPHIVTIHDFGETSGLFYLVMEFIDGVNLRDLLRDGKLESQQALAIVPPICDALQYAHDKGIVHRDIKPENILLDRDGRVKIADFGIASLVGSSGEDSGTPPYMAPEQSGGTVDRRADIYALGVVLYEMLTGERPEKDLIAPSKRVEIDVRLDEIVLRAMEKQPEMRYQTANELRSVVDDFPAHSQTPSLPLAAAPKRGMMRRWWWVFLVMIPLGPIIGLATGAGWASLVPKKYETVATIEIRPQNVEQMGSPEWLGNEFEKLISRRVLADVAEQLDLPANWQVNRDDAVGILKRIVTVENIRGTDLMSVRVRHSNHEQAVDIVNGVVSSYQQSFGGTAIVHELPTLTKFPVSPNVRLFLVLGALGGLLLFPLMAVLLILILHRAFPEKNSASEGREKAVLWFIHLVWAACASGLVALWITFISESLTKDRGNLDQSLMTWEDVYGPVIMVLIGGSLLALPIRKFRFASPRIWIGAVFVTATITTIAYVLAAPVEDRSFNSMNFIVSVGICAFGTSLFGFAADFGKRKTGSNFVADHSKSALVIRKRWTSIGKYGAALGCISLAVWVLFFVAGQFNSDHDNSGGSGAGPIANIKVESMDGAVIDEGLPNTHKPAADSPMRGFENARTRAVYNWKELAAKGGLKDGLVVESEGRTVLKIENSADEPLQAQLITIESPPVDAEVYALRGEVRFEGVQGPAYFEMWSELSEGRFFSRTLGDIGSGPLSPMAGTSGWRSFSLPFDRSGTKNAPVRIELNLFLPGRGTVFVGDLELIEVSPDGAAQNGVTDTPAILTGEEEAPNGDVLRVTLRTAKDGNGDGKSLICQVEGENVDFENLGDHLKSIIGKNKATAVEIASEPDVIMERVMKVAGFVKEAGVEDLRFIALSSDAESLDETSRELTTIRATDLPADNRLQLRMVAPDDPQAIPTEQGLNDGSVRSLNLSQDVILSDQHVEDAGIQKGGGGYEVSITLNEAGSKRMAMATKGADGGMQIAILIDGEIISAPVIQMQLGRHFVISGLRDEKECLGLIRHLVEWPDEPDMAAMTEWLEQVDQGNFETALNTASEYLRENVTPEKWQQMMSTARNALGALGKREMASAKRMDSLPGVPDGQYLVTEFDSSFAEKKEASELVTLHKEKDGRWRVIGYFIR